MGQGFRFRVWVPGSGVKFKVWVWAQGLGARVEVKGLDSRVWVPLSNEIEHISQSTTDLGLGLSHFQEEICQNL